MSKLSPGKKSEKKFGKTDRRYWRDVVYRPALRSNGSRITLQQYYVKLQYRGRREAFPLETNNIEDAVDKAKSIYLSLVASGWEAALREYKPGKNKEQANIVTLGEVITSALQRSDIKMRTLADYARTTRQIVGETLGKGSSASLRNLPKQKKWSEAIDATPLHKVKPEAIEAWRQRLLAAASSGGPVSVRHAKNTINSMLRRAKSLFSPKFLRHLSLPADFSNPFASISFEPRQSTRYQSQINLDTLIAAALHGDEPRKLEKLPTPELKAFLLAALAGLRRNEIDKLEWSSFRWEEKSIRLQVTDYFHPKTEESLADVTVDAELMSLFKGLHDNSETKFVIESKSIPQLDTAYSHYRCQKVFDGLTKWLKLAGVISGTPLHTLRKEFGSMMCSKYGIYGASRALRHRDIQVTSQHYVDTKQPLVPGLAGRLLDPQDKRGKTEGQ